MLGSARINILGIFKCCGADSQIGWRDHDRCALVGEMRFYLGIRLT